LFLFSLFDISVMMVAAAIPSVPLLDLRLSSGRRVTDLNVPELRAVIGPLGGDVSGLKAALVRTLLSLRADELLLETTSGALISGLTNAQLKAEISSLGGVPSGVKATLQANLRNLRRAEVFQAAPPNQNVVPDVVPGAVPGAALGVGGAVGRAAAAALLAAAAILPPPPPPPPPALPLGVGGLGVGDAAAAQAAAAAAALLPAPPVPQLGVGGAAGGLAAAAAAPLALSFKAGHDVANPVVLVPNEHFLCRLVCKNPRLWLVAPSGASPGEMYVGVLQLVVASGYTFDETGSVVPLGSVLTLAAADRLCFTLSSAMDPAAQPVRSGAAFALAVRDRLCSLSVQSRVLTQNDFHLETLSW